MVRTRRGWLRGHGIRLSRCMSNTPRSRSSSSSHSTSCLALPWRRFEMWKTPGMRPRRPTRQRGSGCDSFGMREHFPRGSGRLSQRSAIGSDDRRVHLSSWNSANRSKQKVATSTTSRSSRRPLPRSRRENGTSWCCSTSSDTLSGTSRACSVSRQERSVNACTPAGCGFDAACHRP